MHDLLICTSTNRLLIWLVFVFPLWSCVWSRPGADRSGSCLRSAAAPNSPETKTSLWWRLPYSFHVILLDFDHSTGETQLGEMFPDSYCIFKMNCSSKFTQILEWGDVSVCAGFESSELPESFLGASRCLNMSAAACCGSRQPERWVTAHCCISFTCRLAGWGSSFKFRAAVTVENFQLCSTY